jgi:ABC-type lipoprotein export system ATPase subunit
VSPIAETLENDAEQRAVPQSYLVRRQVEEMSQLANSTQSAHGEDEYLIRLRQVVKTFQTAAGAFTALKGIDLQVGAGEFVAIIGKSGSGKSTLLNMITGIDRPTSGEVIVGDTAVHKLSEGQMAVWRGRHLGIVFQFFQLLPTLTLIENVMLPMDFCNMYPTRERDKRAMRLLDMVEMTPHAHKLPSAVSGGEQQRVAIARALANDPPIIVADEPTGNLDSKTAESVFRLFERLVDQGKTMVMVTHDSDLAKRVTRTAMVSDGQIINEYLAHALPTLSEDQLIQATHKLQPEKYTPGSVIIERGTPPDRFYIVTKGRADILVPTADGQEIVVDRMSSGQYFGEIELMRGGQHIATVRAALDTGAEVVALDRETFAGLIAESKVTEEAVNHVARERIAQHTSVEPLQ